MARFVHQRHKDPSQLPATCVLVLACSPMRSNVNLSRIVRLAGCSGVRRVIACGRPKIDAKIARDALEHMPIETHRSLPPVLKRLRLQGYTIVGLEQTTGSECLYTFPFPLKTVLVIGHERHGLDEATLACLDHVVEIPVFGMPYSFNVATATTMAVYEYGRQCRSAFER